MKRDFSKRDAFRKKYKKISPWWRFIRQEFKLIEAYQIQTYIKGYDYRDSKVCLTPDGLLTAYMGLSWGASGLTIDTKSSRRGSCVHDAGYYLSQKGVFKGKKSERVKCELDDMLRSIAIEDGMYHWRAEIWHEAVEELGFLAWEKSHKS